MKRKAIAAKNVETLLKGKFNFSTQKILNKTILFDTSHVNEEKLWRKILEALPADHDELHVLHEWGTNAFTLKREYGKYTKFLQKAKIVFESLKADEKSVLISEEKLSLKLLKKLKKI